MTTPKNRLEILDNYRREGYTPRICKFNAGRLEELMAEGYKPVLKYEPVLFHNYDSDGGSGILMEIETWAWELRKHGKSSPTVERIISERVATGIDQELADMSAWQMLKASVRKLFGRGLRPTKVKVNIDYDNP